MNEFWRKIVHMFFALLIALLIRILPRDTALMVLGAGLLGGLWFIDLIMQGFRIPIISSLVVSLKRTGVFPGKGAIYFVFSSLMTLILFPSAITAAGVLVLAVLDGLATIFGLRYGRTRIISHKSVERSGGAVLITLLVPLLFLRPAQALVIALVAGIVELGSPVDDNLLIPLVVAILLTVIPG